MSQSLSEEEFARLQAQLIELKTANYNYDEQARRARAEVSQLRDRVSQLDRDLQRANKVIMKSKKAKDVSGLTDENESLQRKIHSMEEEYQLQNRTLMGELSKVCDDNEALKQRLAAAGLDSDCSRDVDTRNDQTNDTASVGELENQVRQLQAENLVFQKSLEASRLRHEEEVADMKRVVESLRSTRLGAAGGRSPAVLKRETIGSVECHQGESSDGEVDASGLSREIDSFLTLLAEKESNWQGESGENDGSDREVLLSALSSIRNRAKELREKLVSSVTLSELGSDETDLTISATQEEIQELSEANFSLRQELRDKEGLQMSLDSLKEEKRLLQDKLQSEQEAHRRASQELEAEIEKLNEKLKKKQEIVLQLQDEKEKLYSDSQSSIADTVAAKDQELTVLMQQSAKVQQELDSTNVKYYEFQLQTDSTVKQLQDALLAAENQARGNTEASGKLLDNLRSEKDAMAAQLEAEKTKTATLEREVHDLRGQVLESTTATEELQNQNAVLAQQAGEQRAQIEECQRRWDSVGQQNKTLLEEKQLAVQELDRMTKLAENRKSTLDKLSIQMQLEADQARQNVADFQNERDDLKNEVYAEREKHQELQAKIKQFSTVERELEQMRNKVAITETEKEELQEQIQQAVARAEQAVEEAQKEVETLQAEVEAAFHTKSDLESRLAAQEQAIEDKEAEMKLNEKKGAALMKDLKRQLLLEKRRSERLQEQLTENKGTRSATYDEGFSLPVQSESARPSSRDSSLSSLTGLPTPSQKESVTSQSSGTALSDDTTALLAKVTELQETNWTLEEKIRHLETNASCLAEDVIQKAAIIQQHYMAVKDKVGDVMPSPKQSRSGAKRMLDGFASPFRGAKEDGNQKEVIAKMQRVLEETLMKNIHLQKNLDDLVGELSQTQEENTRLKERLGIETNET
ncbi:GRIP1-associated protein 1-like [Corticium candelabrum]|uniref:GRIP1-associated protein 1-like n=1 Tax=Corticium candelabrum TaxID=121492 RepID=UPI002E26AC5A|nr:GRIP1-associated protein 1-like [Corticium candelabrum]XP_062522249.1 GRIP1-associated protein 1-like [Corticium candelabrum]